VLRFQADVVALHPLVVHIMAGTNDLAGNTGPETMQDFRNNIIAMATLAKANGIQVVLASIPPAAAFPWRAGLKPTPQILEINAWLKEYARSIGGRYVDYYTLLATPEGAMQPGMTFDGVHATLPGYKAIEPASRTATTPLARR
jgi:lysophospholipase L1-like esterase